MSSGAKNSLALWVRAKEKRQQILSRVEVWLLRVEV